MKSKGKFTAIAWIVEVRHRKNGVWVMSLDAMPFRKFKAAHAHMERKGKENPRTGYRISLYLRVATNYEMPKNGERYVLDGG